MEQAQACMVRRLAFPAPRPLELQLEKRPGVTDKASIVRKPYASHKSKKEAQSRLFLPLRKLLTLHPTLNPA